MTELSLESLQRTNERIGSMLANAKAFAAKNGYSENLVFYVESESRSPILIKKILTDTYGIPEDRFILGQSNGLRRNQHFIDWPEKGKRQMILVLDDFIGSGVSMESFMGYAGHGFRNVGDFGATLPASVHAFAPFSTEQGLKAVSMNNPAFIDSTVKNVSKSYSFGVLKERLGFDTGLGTFEVGTAIGFDYMSPDNNISMFKKILPVWTFPEGIK